MQYFGKILFFFIMVLFLDSVRNAYNNDHDHESASAQLIAAGNMQNSSTLHMKMFRAQRNMYLTGFTMFLALVLNRFMVLINQMVKYEEQLEIVKKQVQSQLDPFNIDDEQASNNSTEYMRLSEEQDGKDEQIKQLQDELKEATKKAKDADAVLKQAKGGNEEYMRLADRYNALEKKMNALTGGGDQDSSKKGL